MFLRTVTCLTNMSFPASASEVLQVPNDLPYAEKWAYMMNYGRGAFEEISSAFTATTTTTTNTATSAPLRETVMCALAVSDDHHDRLLAAMAFRGALTTRAAAHPMSDTLKHTCRRLVLDPSSKISGALASPYLQSASADDVFDVLAGASLKQTRQLLSKISKLQSEQVEKSLKGMIVPAPDAVPAESRQDISETLSMTTEKLSVQKGALTLPYAEASLLAQWWSLNPDLYPSTTTLQKQMVLKQPEVVLAFLDERVTLFDSETLQTRETDGHTAMGPALPHRLSHQITVALAALAGTPERALLGMPLLRRTLHRLSGAKKAAPKAVLTRMLRTPAMPAVMEYLHAHVQDFANLELRLCARAWARLGRDCDKTDTFINDTPVLKVVEDLLRAVVIDINVHHFCHYLSPTLRRMIYDRLPGEVIVQASTGMIDIRMVGAHPDEADRMALARTQFDLAAQKANPAVRLSLLAYLPYPEAMAVAEADHVQNPNVDTRVAAARALIGSGAYHAQHMDAIVAFCLKRNREQDPWRRAMFAALADLPPGCWTRVTDPSAGLTALFQAALEAKDISHHTLAEAQRLLWRLFLCAKDEVVVFAETMLPVLVKRQGALFSQRRDIVQSLPPAAVTRLLTCLLPLLKDEACGSSTRVLEGVWSSLSPAQQRRLAPSMQRIFGIASKSRNASLAAWGFTKLTEHFRPDALVLLPEMLRAEPDWICVSAVNKLVSQHCQGALLDPYLAPLKNLKGRFQKSDSGFKERCHMIFFEKRFLYRWSSAQQHTYAQSLMHVVRTTSAKNAWYIQRFVVEAVAFLPSACLSDGLGSIVSEANTDLAEQRWGLITLGGMQDHASLNELVRALGDSRLRDALGPVMKRLRGLPAEQVVATLHGALRSPQITVQKEAVRCIGDLAEPCALNCILSFVEEKGDAMHRDVFLAVMRGLWSFLSKEAAWRVLDSAAHSQRGAACVALCTVPNEVLRFGWQRNRYTALLTTVLETQKDEDALAHVLKRLQTCSPDTLTKATFAALMPFVNCVDIRSLAEPALSCVLAVPESVVDHGAVADALASLEQPRALRMAVTHLTEMIQNAAKASVPSLAHLGTQLHHALVRCRRQLGLCAPLMIYCQPAEAWLSTMTAMQQAGVWHDGVQVMMLATVNHIEKNLPLTTLDELKHVERTVWRTHSDPSVRRFALNVLTVCSEQHGWSEAALEGLNAYKADADPWVRETAELTCVPQS